MNDGSPRKAKRQPVMVSEETYSKLKHYSSATGASVAHVLSESVEDWLDTVGQARIEALATAEAHSALLAKGGKIVCIDALAVSAAQA